MPTSTTWIYVRQSGAADGDGVIVALTAYHVVVEGFVGDHPCSWTSRAPLDWVGSCRVVRETTSRLAARSLLVLPDGAYLLDGVGADHPTSGPLFEQYARWSASKEPRGDPLPPSNGHRTVRISYDFTGLPPDVHARPGWERDAQIRDLSVEGGPRSGEVTMTVPDRGTGWEGEWARCDVLNAMSSPRGALTVPPSMSVLDPERDEPDWW